MLKYCKNLKFEEEPNYTFIKEQLKAVFNDNTFVYDMNYDWTTHAASIEKKSTFLHLADRQHQLAKRNTLKKLQDETEDKKDDWKNSKLMKNSLPLIMKVPDQNSMVVNYTSCIQDQSVKVMQEHATVVQTPVAQTKGIDKVLQGDNAPQNQLNPQNQPKEGKKCCCLVL